MMGSNGARRHRCLVCQRHFKRTEHLTRHLRRRESFELTQLLLADLVSSRYARKALSMSGMLAVFCQEGALPTSPAKVPWRK